MVGHHHHRLGDQAHPAQLHSTHDHLGRFAGTDLVEETDSRLRHHACHCGTLMWPRIKRCGHARQAEEAALGAVVAEDDRVEPAVVFIGQTCRALRFFPHPLGEALLHFLRFVGSGRRLQRVQHTPLGSGVFVLVVHAQGTLLERCGRDIDRRAALGAPLVGGKNRTAVTAHLPHGRQRVLHLHGAVAQNVLQKLLVGGLVDPYRAHPRLDLLHRQRRRQYRLEGTHIAGIPFRILVRCSQCCIEFDSHITAEVFRGSHNLSGGRVVIGEFAERGARLGRVFAKEVGDRLQLDAPVPIQTECDRFRWRVSALSQGPL